METYDIHVVKHESPHESEKAVCRCCLSTNRRMLRIEFFETHFNELAGINISESNDLPQHICYECSALLHNAVRFKRKVLRVQEILHEYQTRCSPFTMDAEDPELVKLACPTLSMGRTLHLDIEMNDHNVYQKTMKHENASQPSKLATVEITVKPELDYFYNEDNIHQPGSGGNSSNETSSDGKGQRITKNKVVENIRHKRNLRVKKQISKVQIKKQTTRGKKNDSSNGYELLKQRLPKPAIFDPKKVRVIHLNPKQQLQLREEVRKANLKFLYRCKFCYLGFNFEYKLQNHMTKHDPARGNFKCQMCSVYTPSAQTMGSHLLTHTRRYECVRCGLRMLSSSHMKDHYEIEHEGVKKVVPCELCDKKCHSKKAYAYHLRSQHMAQQKRCKICAMCFDDKDALTDHLRSHVRGYHCDQCEKQYYTRSELVLHQASHSNTRKYSCVECDRWFDTPSNLRRHLLSSIHRKVPKPYACQLCDNKRYELQRDLLHHIRTNHEGARPFSCDICGVSVSTKSSVKKHILAVHNGYRAPAKHVCEVCGKAFRTNTALKNHSRTHTGEKPFECAQCGRRFSQRSSRDTHIKLVHLKVGRKGKIKKQEKIITEELDHNDSY